MKKILFDLAATQPSVSGKRHGGGIYGEKVFEKLIDSKSRVVGYCDSAKWFNPVIEKIVLTNNVELVYISKESLSGVIERIKSYMNSSRNDRTRTPIASPVI